MKTVEYAMAGAVWGFIGPRRELSGSGGHQEARDKCQGGAVQAKYSLQGRGREGVRLPEHPELV